ncbi:putative uncharacterized protein DDB_G0282133 [Chrysoperla carnea]|uniref:putative uncharacterized protein DDB_G0282133 n=1 Tax=Chrysoperla carnea TaxID=189513 RepID=UPI001D0704C5|nr:putative uncharacterized protein DDB_G0282133 [Chrysoperla carnea]
MKQFSFVNAYQENFMNFALKYYRRKSGDESNNIHSTPVNKHRHNFGEYSTSRLGNRKITYSLTRKSPTSESEVSLSFDNQQKSFNNQEILEIQENFVETQELFIDDHENPFDNQDEDTLDSTSQTCVRIFNELGNVSPDNFAEPNGYKDFIIENNDHIIDLTTYDIDDITLSDDKGKENKNDNVADSTNNKEIIDKDIIDFVEKNQIDNDDTSYDMNRLWKDEEMLEQVKNCPKKIFMSVQKFKNLANVQKKIITETSLVEDEIMGVHMAPNISINANLSELESVENDSDDNNNQQNTISATHTLPVRPAPKFVAKSMCQKSVTSTSSSEINQILQKQIALSENDPRKKKEYARILRILTQQKLLNEETNNMMKNRNTQNHEKIERKRSITTEHTKKHDENNSYKRSKPCETITKSNATFPLNQKDLERKGSSFSSVELKSNEVQPSLLSTQCGIRTQSDKNKVKQKLNVTESRSSIQVSGFEKKDETIIVKESNETKNEAKKSQECENIKLPIQTSGPEKNDQNVNEKKMSHYESKSQKHDSSKKNIDKHSKKEYSSSHSKKSSSKYFPDKATLKECVVLLERRHEVENCLKRQLSREKVKHKKSKSEHSDKNKISKSKKRREHSHKSSNHYKSSHSSSKHKSSSDSSSKSKIIMEDKITNDLNGLTQQLIDLKNKANRNDYKTKQSDDNPLKMKIRKIHEENINQTLEISSTSEIVRKKPWDENLRTLKYSWINNNLIQEEGDDIEQRLALLEGGVHLFTGDNVEVNVERIENDSMHSVSDMVSTTHGREPCGEQGITSSSEVTTSCVTPPVINNEDLSDFLTINPVSINETNMTQNNVEISKDCQNLNFERNPSVIQENLFEVIQPSENNISLVNPELQKSVEIEKHYESTEKMDEKIDNNQVIHNSGTTIKNESEIPIIDLTYTEFIKKEEPSECEIIEIEDEIPMLRVRASIFLNQEANNIIEKIKNSMSFICSDVRTFNKRIRKLTNKIEKTREELLKTEHIEMRARTITPILATHLHYFNDTNMFKALTQAINDSADKQFNIDHVENVFHLLVNQSPILRQEFLGYKNNIEPEPNLDWNRSVINQINNKTDGVQNPPNIIYNASNNLEQTLQNNTTVNNHTTTHSNTVRNDGGQESNYLINSSTPLNGYYNPQSAQVYSGYQFQSSPLTVNSMQNNNILNNSINSSQIRNKFPPAYNEVIATNQNQDNLYNATHSQNNYNWTHQRHQGTGNYSADMYTEMNLSYSTKTVPSQLQPQTIQNRPELQQHRPQLQQYQQQSQKQTALQNQPQGQYQKNDQSTFQSAVQNQPQLQHQQESPQQSVMQKQQQLQQSHQLHTQNHQRLQTSEVLHQKQLQQTSEVINQKQLQQSHQPHTQNHQRLQTSEVLHQKELQQSHQPHTQNHQRLQTSEVLHQKQLQQSHQPHTQNYQRLQTSAVLHQKQLQQYQLYQPHGKPALPKQPAMLNQQQIQEQQYQEQLQKQQLQKRQELQYQQKSPKQLTLQKQQLHQTQTPHQSQSQNQQQLHQPQLLHTLNNQELQKQQNKERQWYQFQQKYLLNQQDQRGSQEQQLVTKKKRSSKKNTQIIPEPPNLIPDGNSTIYLRQQLLYSDQSEAGINQPRQISNFKDGNLKVPTSIATSNIYVPKHAINNVQDISSPALNSLTTVNNDIYGSTSVIRNTTSNVQKGNNTTNNVQDISSSALNSLTTVNNDKYGGTSVIRTAGTFEVPSVSSAASTPQYNIVWGQPGSNCNMTPTLGEYSNNEQSNINQNWS